MAKPSIQTRRSSTSGRFETLSLIHNGFGVALVVRVSKVTSTTLPSSCLPLIGREVKTREVSSAAVMLFPWTITRSASFMILSLLPNTSP